MTNEQPKKFINISELFDGVGEEGAIWGIVEHVLERNGIEPKSGIKGLSVRYYDDGNPIIQERGIIDESWTTQSKSHIWDSVTY